MDPAWAYPVEENEVLDKSYTPFPASTSDPSDFILRAKDLDMPL